MWTSSPSYWENRKSQPISSLQLLNHRPSSKTNNRIVFSRHRNKLAIGMHVRTYKIFHSLYLFIENNFAFAASPSLRPSHSHCERVVIVNERQHSGWAWNRCTDRYTHSGRHRHLSNECILCGHWPQSVHRPSQFTCTSCVGFYCILGRELPNIVVLTTYIQVLCCMVRSLGWFLLLCSLTSVALAVGYWLANEDVFVFGIESVLFRCNAYYYKLWTA